jgi:hypothetical protein
MTAKLPLGHLLNVLFDRLPIAGEDKPRPYCWKQALLVAAGFIPAPNAENKLCL